MEQQNKKWSRLSAASGISISDLRQRFFFPLCPRLFPGHRIHNVIITHFLTFTLF
jgi:hypothetical protein